MSIKSKIVALSVLLALCASQALAQGMPNYTNRANGQQVPNQPAWPVPGDNWSTGQVSVDTTAGGTTIRTARDGRLYLIITNLSATAAYCGPSSPTSSNGQLLPGAIGASITIPYTGIIKCIAGSGTAIIGYSEIW